MTDAGRGCHAGRPRLPWTAQRVFTNVPRLLPLQEEPELDAALAAPIKPEEDGGVAGGQPAQPASNKACTHCNIALPSRWRTHPTTGYPGALESRLWVFPLVPAARALHVWWCLLPLPAPTLGPSRRYTCTSLPQPCTHASPGSCRRQAVQPVPGLHGQVRACGFVPQAIIPSFGRRCWVCVCTRCPCFAADVVWKQQQVLGKWGAAGWLGG